MPLDELLGPAAALAGALTVVGVLWRDHQRSDADDRAERDSWKAIALRLMEQIPGLSSSVAEQTRQINDMDKRSSQRTFDAVEKLLDRLGK